jgi:DNA damage-inducible protein 1
MKLTINNEATGAIISVDIPESLTLDDFKAYLEAETGIDPSHQILKYNGHLLHDNKLLAELGISDNDLIAVAKMNSLAPTSAPTSAPPSHDQFEVARQQLLANRQLADQLTSTNPELASVLHDPNRFKQLMLEQMNSQYGLQQQELQKLQQNPDDPESQAKILDLIRQEQIEENMKLAYDITPESFASVTMLYIDMVVNGHKVQAFVDSGAQTTIISSGLAEKVGIDRLIDKRFQGEARGVGSQKIQGKIHSTPIKIGDSDIELPCSFVVIDTQVDLLFGLDMLRRHKCVIDLEHDQLVVGGHITTKFLPESQIENKMFGGGQAVSNNGPGFGGNIFSEPSKPPASAVSAAGAAAVKRQNTGKSTTSSASTPSTSSSNSYVPSDSEIKQLVDLGFTRSEAVKALQATNGNIDMAASLLFQ